MEQRICVCYALVPVTISVIEYLSEGEYLQNGLLTGITLQTVRV